MVSNVSDTTPVSGGSQSHRLPKIIAHRGASSVAPENTLLAFQLAIEAGAQVIETDAHLTRDGEIVLIHDEDLRRTTSCSGIVAYQRLADLAPCDAGYWFAPNGEPAHPFRERGLTVPRLADLLDLVTRSTPEVVVNVEIKNAEDDFSFDPGNRLAVRLVDLLRQLDAFERVIVSSFNPAAVDLVQELKPAIRTALLCGPRSDLDGRTAYARARGHDAIHPHHSLLGSGERARRRVDVLRQAGLEVSVWTVNEPQRMLELAAAGVDGIISDDPALLRRVLDGGVVAA